MPPILNRVRFDRMAMASGFIQVGKVAFERAKSTDNRGVKLETCVWHMGHGSGDAFRRAMDMIDRLDLSDLERRENRRLRRYYPVQRLAFDWRGKKLRLKVSHNCTYSNYIGSPVQY